MPKKKQDKEKIQHDFSNKMAATILAENIVKYWRSLGYYNIRAWVELTGQLKGEAVYGVKSNLTNGLPPDEWRIHAEDSRSNSGCG